MKNKLIICLTFALGNRLLAAQAGEAQTAAQKKIAAIKQASALAKQVQAEQASVEAKAELKVVVNYFDNLINWKNAQKDSSKALNDFLKTLDKNQLANLILQAEDLKNKLTNQKINAFVKNLLNGEIFLSNFEEEFPILLEAVTKEEEAKEAAAKAKAIEAKVIEAKAKEAAVREAVAKKEAAVREAAAKIEAAAKKEAAAKIEIEAAAEKYSVSKFLTPEQKQYLGNFASIFVKNVLETEVPGLKVYKKDFWSRVKQWLTSKSTDNKYRINLAQKIAKLLLGSFESKKTITIDEYLNINSKFNSIRLETLQAELELAVIQKEIAILELKKAVNTSADDHKAAAEALAAKASKTALEYKLAAEAAKKAVEAAKKAAAYDAEAKANAAREALEAFQRETAAREAAMREAAMREIR